MRRPHSWWAAGLARSDRSGEPLQARRRHSAAVEARRLLLGPRQRLWNNNTREAMRSFTTHTNAALPVEKPDYLLLSLLKSHSGRSCGAPETTVVAQPRWQRRTGRRHAAAAGSAAVEGRQRCAAGDAPLYAAAEQRRLDEPLPGRMAIGGPRELPPAVQAPLIPGTPPGPPQDSRVSPPRPSTRAALHRLPFPRRPLGRSRVKPRSQSWRRPGPGTPRYNLMLSLGGVTEHHCLAR